MGKLEGSHVLHRLAGITDAGIYARLNQPLHNMEVAIMNCGKKGITVWLRNIEPCAKADEVVQNIFVAIRSSPMDWAATTEIVSTIYIGSQLD